MREREFHIWLRHHYRTAKGHLLDPRSQSSTRANCRRVERSEGDLDRHFETDGLEGVLRRLTDGSTEVRAQGNRGQVLASLKSATARYKQFCRDWPSGGAPRSPAARLPKRTVVTNRAGRGKAVGTARWPTWEPPSAEDILALGRCLARHVRFLAPEIVAAVVEDNERHRMVWSEALTARGVDADRYIWKRGACTFPGVRRYVGSAEIARHRKKAGDVEAASVPPNALATDDNAYPKHLWSFVLRGRPFQQFGPAGYELAHLLDHKEYKNRLAKELIRGEALSARVPYGLFTCAGNAIFVPRSLLRPTDHAGLIRGLLQRRGLALYGSFCDLVPPPATIPPAPAPDWEIEAFDWAEPVAAEEPLDRFLAFRRERMEMLIAAHGAA